MADSYCVLIPISKKTASQPVIEIASALIAAHGGELIALGVVSVPPERSYSYGTAKAFGYRHLLKRLTRSELNLISREGGDFHLQSREIYDHKRPPMLMVPEYQKKLATKKSDAKEKPLI